MPSLRSIIRITLSLIVLLGGVTAAHAQDITQTIRGKVLDEDTRSPLPGASVVVVGHPGLGATTDADGDFRINGVPIGRISLTITFIGYEDRALSNLLVTTGKELVLELTLRESLVMMEAVEIKGNADKSTIANDMAITSARGFTVEETRRYAGSFNDPARMVSAYAGVDVEASGDNFIIVRGNSPKGIQWRLEGIDIPNPNHFSDEGATGGPINALNSQMLSDSEFYTGAFPAEYGNALSGVFDMKLRKGNDEKREYAFSIGALGTDATIEGPFVKGGRSSYLVNYRYSTLTLLNNLGVVDFNGIPKYQDLSFKLHLPTRTLGTFSVFGVGGKSNIIEEEFEDDNDDVLLERGDYQANMGVVGVTQYWSLEENTYLQNSFSLSQNGSGYLGHKPYGEGLLRKVEDFNLDKNSTKAATTLTHKFNARHTVQGGLLYTRHNFDFYDEEYRSTTGDYVEELNMRGSADQYQGFASWKYRPAEDITLVSGFHVQKISLGDEVSIEPRASMRWQFNPTQAMTAGFGIHGKMESLPTYFAIIPDASGNPRMPNQDLELSKARHYVVGYENRLTSNLFLKVEGYYQQLYNVPVEDDTNSSYSLVNQAQDLTDRVLVNAGTGHNIGLEFTLERYFADSYYFMVTASVFDSKYKALDGIERNTLFNSHLVGNILVGKEFVLNSVDHRKKVISVNARISSLGGRRYTPINLDESIAQDATVFYEDEAFTRRGDNVFIANLAVSYRIDTRRISQELKLDIQNATNNAARIGYYYDSNKKEIEGYDQLSMLPVVSYTIYF